MGNRSGVCFKCVQRFLHHLTLPWKNQDNVLIFQSGMKRFKTFFFFLHFSGAHNTSRAMCSPWFCCCFFFFASGSFKSVQAGVFIKPSQLTQSYSFSPLSSSNRLPFSPCHQLVIRAASHHTEEHSSKDPEGTSQPPFFPTKSASETTDRRLLGHLSALRAGGVLNTSYCGTKKTCVMLRSLRAKHAQRGRCLLKVTKSNPLASGLILGIEGLVAGWRGLEPFWRPCSQGRKETTDWRGDRDPSGRRCWRGCRWDSYRSCC